MNQANIYVVKRLLKTAKEELDVKQLGKLFHKLRPVDKKYKSSILRSNLGTSILLLSVAPEKLCEAELRAVMMLKSSILGK